MFRSALKCRRRGRDARRLSIVRRVASSSPLRRTRRIRHSTTTTAHRKSRRRLPPTSASRLCSGWHPIDTPVSLQTIINQCALQNLMIRIHILVQVLVLTLYCIYFNVHYFFGLFVGNIFFALIGPYSSEI